MRMHCILIALGALAYASGTFASADRAQQQRLWLADQILEARKAHNTAVEHDALQRLVSIDPNDARTQLELLRFLVRADHKDLSEIDHVISKLCRNADAQACQQAQVLQGVLQGAAAERLNNARLMAMAGQYLKAAEIFDNLFQGVPQENSLLLEYARYLMQSKTRQAEGRRLFIRLARSHSLLIAREAELYLREHDFEQELEQALEEVYSAKSRHHAVIVLERLLEERPNDPRCESWRSAVAEARYWLACDKGDAYLAQGRMTQARASFESAARLFPDRPFAYAGLADVNAANGNFSAARKDIERALRHASAESESYRRALKARIGRFQLAEAKLAVARLAPAGNELGRFAATPTEEYVRALEHALELSGSDPWIMYDLARALYLRGDQPQALRLWQKVPKDPQGQFCYAQALFLRSIDRPSQARGVLDAFLTRFGEPEDAVAARIWLEAQAAETVGKQSDGEKTFLRTLARLALALDDEIFAREADALAESQRYSQALETLLKVRLPEPWQLAKAARWAEFAGDGSRAYELWRRVATSPDWRTESVFGQCRALLLMRSPRAGDLTVGLIRDLENDLLASDKLGLEDVMRMLAALEEVKRPLEAAELVERHADRFGAARGYDAAVFWRRIAEQRELAGDDAAALSAYEKGFVSAGLLRSGEDFTEAMRTPEPSGDPHWLALSTGADFPEPAVRRQDAQIALVRFEVVPGQNLAPARRDASTLSAPDPLADNGWLAVSMRSRASRLYQRNQVVFQSGLHCAIDGGTKGYSDLTAFTWMNEVSFPVLRGRATLRTDSVGYDTGSLGGSSRNFGTLREWAGADAADPVNSDFGQSLAFIWEGENIRFDLGTTPLGFVYEDVSAGASFDWELGDFSMSTEVYFRPETSSLLAFGGQRDPATGRTWGGVRKLGAALNFSHDQGEENGFWGRFVVESLTGRQVADNYDVQAMLGWYRRLVDQPNHQRMIGLSALYWHYDKDLSDYYWGQGGYWSPQHAVSLGGFYEQARRHTHWSWLLRANLGISWSKTQDHARYPVQSDMLSHTVPDAYAVDSGESSFGPWVSLYAAAERRLTKRLTVGMAASYQNSDEYAPFYAGLWLRWTFSDWLGDLALPPTPMTPYAAR